MASTQTSTSTAAAQEACGNCKKQSAILKACAKCKTTKYCDRECQKAHWKAHKKQCVDNAAGAGVNPNQKPFTAIHHNVYLHNRSREEQFRILIDTLRMRQEDMYAFDQIHMLGSIYDPPAATSEVAFRNFMTMAKDTPGFLPSDWNDAATEECVQFGLRETSDYYLGHAVEKHDIQKTWKDDQMPMKLRMLAEKVYGTGPGGANGASMLKMQMKMESGMSGMYSSHLDVSQAAMGRR